MVFMRQMPKNPSVENFWYLFLFNPVIPFAFTMLLCGVQLHRMLVDNGDLPQPDQNVLSAPLFPGSKGISLGLGLGAAGGLSMTTTPTLGSLMETTNLAIQMRQMSEAKEVQLPLLANPQQFQSAPLHRQQPIPSDAGGGGGGSARSLPLNTPTPSIPASFSSGLASIREEANVSSRDNMMAHNLDRRGSDDSFTGSGASGRPSNTSGEQGQGQGFYSADKQPYAYTSRLPYAQTLAGPSKSSATPAPAAPTTGTGGDWLQQQRSDQIWASYTPQPAGSHQQVPFNHQPAYYSQQMPGGSLSWQGVGPPSAAGGGMGGGNVYAANTSTSFYTKSSGSGPAGSAPNTMKYENYGASSMGSSIHVGFSYPSAILPPGNSASSSSNSNRQYEQLAASPQDGGAREYRYGDGESGAESNNFTEGMFEGASGVVGGNHGLRKGGVDFGEVTRQVSGDGGGVSPRGD